MPRSPVGRPGAVRRQLACFSAPVMSLTSTCGFASLTSRVATLSPERMTVTLSEISWTSSIRWEMNSALTPVDARRRKRANRRSRVAISRADVASSRISIFGRRTSARTMQHACRSLSDRASTGTDSEGGVSRSSPRSCSAVFSRSVRAIRDLNRSSLPSQTFSSTERGAATSTSWNTVAMPALSAACGELSGTESPPTSTWPRSGACTPARIFTSVLLPDPFSP